MVDNTDYAERKIKDFKYAYKVAMNPFENKAVDEIIDAMFENVGYNSTTVNINISGWNMSNISSISSLFDGTGYYASTVDIIIPRTNGNGVNNTPSSFVEYSHITLSVV